jgi:hypothetical protein
MNFSARRTYRYFFTFDYCKLQGHQKENLMAYFPGACSGVPVPRIAHFRSAIAMGIADCGHARCCNRAFPFAEREV